MADCTPFLRDVLARIEPSQSQKDGAQRSHVHLRELLDSGRFAARILDSYLSGSYARKTAIAPIDDVDLVFIIDPKPWLSGLEDLLNQRPEPAHVLESLASAIRYRYSPSSSPVRVQRRSVRLQLYHLDIDAVPGIVAKENAKFIYIPDLEDSSWILTSPRTHAEMATSANQARGNLFKPLVKLLKLWNANLPSTARFKSFAIETIALHLFRQYSLPSLPGGHPKSPTRGHPKFPHLELG